jgi:hypothetical protein
MFFFFLNTLEFEALGLVLHWLCYVFFFFILKTRGIKALDLALHWLCYVFFFGKHGGLKHRIL